MNAILESALDIPAVKQRQQAVWASGDYASIGVTLQIVGEMLAEAADVRADERVLDVCAGNGNAALAAARRRAQVTAADYVSALLDKGRERARGDGLAITFQLADAEALPFGDASFDVVLSTFGVMFTPDQPRAAAEMLRVLRPGGRIGLANWTPEGFIGRALKAVGAQVPPPAGLASPLLWGTEPHLVKLFGAQAANFACQRRQFNFRYRSPAHWVQVFRDQYGPAHKAFAALDAKGAASLEAALTRLLEELNVGGAHSLVVPGEYLEAVITKR